MRRDETADCVTECAASYKPTHQYHRDVAIARNEVRTPDGVIVFYSYIHPLSNVEIRHWTYEECIGDINTYWAKRDRE